METNKKKRGVMNNASEIEERFSKVSPLAMTCASTIGFPYKISTVR